MKMVLRYDTCLLPFFGILCCCATGFTALSQPIPAVKATALADISRKNTDSVYVLNFWATWCRPCIAEMPHLLSVWKKYQAQQVQLLLVSVDDREQWPRRIREVTIRREMDAPVLWLNETDADYFCNLVDPRWSGAIPATLIIRPATGYRAFFETEFSAASFEEEILKALGSRTEKK